MQSPTTPEPATETPSPATKREVIAEPQFDGPAKPIAEFAGRADFPKCALGEHVDIGGYAGVVVEIVNQSIKVRSPEGIIQSFNIVRLRRLYAPTPRPEAETVSAPATRVPEFPKPAAHQPEIPAPIPERVVIQEPDFTAPLQPIREFAGRADFPKCVFGKHLDIVGYQGVVVEIVKQSLKVMDTDGYIRSYNVDVLRKLYGKA